MLLAPMKFSLFRRGPRAVEPRRAGDDAEKLIAEGFRVLGQLCTRLADVLEAQRLEKQGYRDQGKFLERTGPKPGERKP